MVSINQAIFSYPDGTGAMALSEHHYKLVAFAQQFAMRTGAKVEGIARRHDVCGVSCGRLHYRLCEKCDKPDDAEMAKALLTLKQLDKPKPRKPLSIPIPSPLIIIIAMLWWSTIAFACADVPPNYDGPPIDCRYTRTWWEHLTPAERELVVNKSVTKEWALVPLPLPVTSETKNHPDLPAKFEAIRRGSQGR